MKYVVEFEDGEQKEFRAVSHERLRANVKRWMEEEGTFTQCDVYTEEDRFLFTIYL